MSVRTEARNSLAHPVATLNEIHDCLALALDATERRNGYSQSEREARAYMRAALRQTCKLMEVRA